jgi:ubiquinone/menaquinone biosynthesis C-methylase UbiE
LTAVRDYYEELWERLPEHLEPPDLQLRAAFARANVRPGDRVLDLGCGDGALTGVLADTAGVRARPPGDPAAAAAGGGGGAPHEPATAASVVGVDVADAALRRARARHPALTFALAPIDGALPFDDGSFDVVWASEVIEHVADTARWLSEVRRVLVPRGRLLVTTPNHGRLQLAIGGIERYSEPLGDHLHLYSARSLRQLLVEFDFEVGELRGADGPPLVKRLLLASAVR